MYDVRFGFRPWLDDDLRPCNVHSESDRHWSTFKFTFHQALLKKMFPRTCMTNLIPDVLMDRLSIFNARIYRLNF